jgi:hypothetical protein
MAQADRGAAGQTSFPLANQSVSARRVTVPLSSTAGVTPLRRPLQAPPAPPATRRRPAKVERPRSLFRWVEPVRATGQRQQSLPATPTSSLGRTGRLDCRTDEPRPCLLVQKRPQTGCSCRRRSTGPVASISKLVARRLTPTAPPMRRGVRGTTTERDTSHLAPSRDSAQSNILLPRRVPSPSSISRKK